MRSEPLVDTTHTMPVASGDVAGTVRVTGSVGGSLAFGPGLGSGKVDAGLQAGISGSLRPLDVEVAATYDRDSWCVDMSVGGSADLGLVVAAWLPGYDADLSWPLWSRSFDYAGPWRAPVPCPTDAPRWVGTVTTEESYSTRGTSASQKTTYEIGYRESTYSSEYSDSGSIESPPCGTMFGSYSGVAAGDYSTLEPRAVPRAAGGHELFLFGVDDRHFHRGTRTSQSCNLVDGSYRTVTSTTEDEVVVYPPRHLGCVDTAFPVARGDHEVVGTVSRSCETDGVVQESTWTYDLRLDPCDLTRDSDGGGTADCVEVAFGLDPADESDD